MVVIRVLIVVICVGMFVACSGQQAPQAEETQGSTAEQGDAATQGQVYEEDFEGEATTATVEGTEADAGTEEDASERTFDE